MNDDLQRFLDELRTRISIVDVVGSKVKLVKKGREYQGLCPFHNEKTPSFTVNETKGFYHCFGCGAHGDIIKFEMEANGLPFMDAIQKLAHLAGLPLPKFSLKDKEESDNKKSLYDIMESACCFFEKSLLMPEGNEGLKYFTDKRGLTKDIIKKFRLGYAPQNNALMANLKAQGIDNKDLTELGLIAIPEDKTRRPHDFFRNRVMIPITNKQGKIIAFGGRVMEKIEPKYLNSPDTPIFNKRRNLYNLDKARETAFKEKKLIICEGYMDVIALDSYGFNYAVAPLGTALTEDQIAEAWKVCPEPILCLDGDAPGRKAAMRAVDRVLPMLKAGYSLKFLFLPDNMDPDEYLHAHGKNSFSALMEETKPLIDILWQKYTEEQDISTPERKALIEKTLWEEVGKIPDNIVKSYYAQEIKNRIYQHLKKTAWNKTPTSSTSPKNPTLPNTQVTTSTIKQSHIKPETRYQRSTSRPYNKRNTLNHTIIPSPQELTQCAENETNKNWRFIIASLFIYPELISDYEEEILSADIKDNDLLNLLTTISKIAERTTTPLTTNMLIDEVLKTQDKQTMENLWELNMLKERKPFINELRKNIESLLLNFKLQTLGDEIKNLNQSLCQNFNEEDYIRLKALQQEYDKILTTATSEHD